MEFHMWRRVEVTGRKEEGPAYVRTVPQAQTKAGPRHAGAVGAAGPKTERTRDRAS